LNFKRFNLLRSTKNTAIIFEILELFLLAFEDVFSGKWHFSDLKNFFKEK